MKSYCINCGNELEPNEKYCTSCGKKGAATTNENSQPGAKYFQYEELPDHVKNKLFSRQNAKLSSQIMIKSQGVLSSYLWATFLFLWVPFLFLLSNSSQWSNYEIFGLSLVTIVISILFSRAARFIIKWHQSTMKCNFYLTPLYFIKTYFNEIWCWGVWTIKDFKITHHYTNRVYQHSSAELILPNSSEQLVFVSKKDVQNFLNTIEYFCQRITEAQSKRHWQYFLDHDDFYNMPESKKATPKVHKSATYRQYALATCAGIIISFGGYYNNLSVSHEYHQIAPQETNQQKRPQFNEPEKPLPYNGMTKNYTSEECNAPLKIVTKSDMHYYVKIVDWYTNRLVQTIFIRAGRTVETQVPLGSYKIKYAVGAIWYGEIHRFGPETAYSEADDRLDFKIIDNQISGYTIELFLQRNGNLETRRISANDF
ncbi:zinc ribbon domain-containing protein [candidate division KSB1 bacterium]|nr:zinc ribbon domain-containing protein [candidate division KSB1 bacterium]